MNEEAAKKEFLIKILAQREQVFAPTFLSGSKLIGVLLADIS